MKNFAKLYEHSRQLLVTQTVLEDEVGEALVQLLSWIPVSDEGTGIDPAYAILQDATVSGYYTRLFRLLAIGAENYTGHAVGDAWQNHLLDRLLDSDSIVAIRARQSGFRGLSAALRAAFGYDLTRLATLYHFDSPHLVERIREVPGNAGLPHWLGFEGIASVDHTEAEKKRAALKEKLAAAEDWTTLLNELVDFYRQNDPSPFARHTAFRWRNEGEAGRLVPVGQLDRQFLENLVGYERERAVVLANTEQFLAGAGANHVLLYGARGTGKSSTVKALLPRYASRGLRLIEVHKSELGDYPQIAEAVRGRPEKFILFVDDLSFEADEISYKDLKALLEGSLEARPANLLIYATSNRRHLVKEQFSDNARPGDDEVNAWDTVEEKLSLSDRFGLLITFLAPNQREYLAIVDGLASQAGITLEPAELHRRALRWEMSHSGRSGRTARQFVDQLAGELQLQNRPA